MIVTVFRSRLDPEHETEYEMFSEEVHELGTRMPGFVSIKTFTAEDGERVSIVEFESEEALTAWREHPRHREAQTLGRERFFLEYSITTCRVMREARFSRLTPESNSRA